MFFSISSRRSRSTFFFFSIAVLVIILKLDWPFHAPSLTMKKVCWPYFDPQFDTLSERVNGPTCRVTIDNEKREDCTVVEVDRINKEGLLLEVVQVLTDMNLQIYKSYISSDVNWCLDVFHVRDKYGNKLKDQNVLNYIQQTIGRLRGSPYSIKAYSNQVSPNYLHSNEYTAIEMTGTDHPGLFSEISAALADLHCNIVEAHSWTHNAILACVAYITDQSTHSSIKEPSRLAHIKDRITAILRGTTNPNSPCTNQKEVKTTEFHGGEGIIITAERRLHQLMLSVRDFKASPSDLMTVVMSSVSGEQEMRRKRMVKIESCKQKGYSIVSIECKDRLRLMFDIVCTLTDMQYVISHGYINSHEGYAFQEYFIRHVDGHALCTKSDKERVAKCLEAAIERRVCEGVKVELCAENRVGMLSDITRMLRENGLDVVRADVETHGEKSVNAFYVRDLSGNCQVHIDDFVQSVKREMGSTVLHISNNNIHNIADDTDTTPLISFEHKSMKREMGLTVLHINNNDIHNTVDDTDTTPLISFEHKSMKREMGPAVLHVNNNNIHNTANDTNTTPLISFIHKLKSHIKRLSRAFRHIINSTLAFFSNVK